MVDDPAGTTSGGQGPHALTWALAAVIVALVATLAAVLLVGGDDDGNDADVAVDDREEPASSGNDSFGDADFIIFMNPVATAAQVDAISQALEDNEAVVEIDYLDRQESYEEFQRLFSDDPALMENVSPEILPTSFKVQVAADADRDVVEAIGEVYSTEPGVREVAFRSEASDRLAGEDG